MNKNGLQRRKLDSLTSIEQLQAWGKGVDTERSAVQRSVGVAECHSHWWQEAAPNAPGLRLVVVMARGGRTVAALNGS